MTLVSGKETSPGVVHRAGYSTEIENETVSGISHSICGKVMHRVSCIQKRKKTARSKAITVFSTVQ